MTFTGGFQPATSLRLNRLAMSTCNGRPLCRRSAMWLRLLPPPWSGGLSTGLFKLPERLDGCSAEWPPERPKAFLSERAHEPFATSGQPSYQSEIEGPGVLRLTAWPFKFEVLGTAGENEDHQELECAFVDAA